MCYYRSYEKGVAQAPYAIIVARQAPMLSSTPEGSSAAAPTTRAAVLQKWVHRASLYDKVVGAIKSLRAFTDVL